MKKLGRLSINPAKLMNNEELVSLKGGDQYGTHWVVCSCGAQGSTSTCDPDFIRQVCNSYCGSGWSASCV